MLSWIYGLPIKRIKEQDEFSWSAELLATEGVEFKLWLFDDYGFGAMLGCFSGFIWKW